MNFSLPPGSWTDDTSMTLCLAQSFISTRTFSPSTQLQNYIAWYKSGYLSPIDYCFDIGNLTRLTLGFWKHHIPEKPDRSIGDSDTNSSNRAEQAEPVPAAIIQEHQSSLNKAYKRSAFSGNGSLMRTVPIGLFYHSSPTEDIIKYSHAASELTHPYPTNGEACAVYNILVAYALSSSSSTPTKSQMFAKFKSFEFTDPTLRERFAVYDSLGDVESRDVDLISSSGYVVDSLEAALWAFFTTGSWDEGALKVVNLDTVGAIYGGLAGAYYGFEAIKPKWIEELLKREVVEKIANDLYRVIAERQQ
ncbi:hypothetical protein ABW20_dc0106116 [Dactylellina cionopaga]|nr:hypothetical protein ABW20_dc0106116 [Dactylellina cionopaga]